MSSLKSAGTSDPGGGSLFSSTNGLGTYLRRGLTSTFLLNVAGKSIAFLTSIALARLMGPSSLGVYALALAVAQLLCLPSALGLPGVVVRYVSLYDTEERWALMRGLLKSALQLTLTLSVLLTVVGCLVVWWLSDRLGEEKTTSLLIALWMIPFLDFAGFRSATLQGLRHVVLAQIPDVFLRPVLLLGILALVWWWVHAPSLGSVQVLEVHLLVVSLTFLLGIVMLWRKVPQQIRNTPSSTDYSRWRNSLLPFMFIHTTQIILNQTDTIMLGVLSADIDVGLYKVACQLAELTSFTLGIVNVVIQPMISRLYAQGDYVQLQRMITSTTRLSAFLSIPVTIGLLILGPLLLPLVYGEAYLGSYSPMVILVVGQVINVGAGSVGLLLFMTGHERDAAWAIGLATALNIALDAVSIPVFGIGGAAWASTVSLVFWNIVLYFRVRKRLGLYPTVFGRHL